MKINSPAYKLPKSRNANEIGFAIKATVSNRRLTGIIALWLKRGCSVSSLTNPDTPLTFNVVENNQQEHTDS